MASNRKIYWGLRDEREIPKMAACGEGKEPGGGSGGAGSGQKKPKEPKNLGKFDFLADVAGQLGSELKDAAIGTLAAALVGEPAFGVFLQKNRPSTDEKIFDLQGQIDDLNSSLDSPSRSSARGDLGDRQDLLNKIKDLEGQINLLLNNLQDT